MHTTPPQALRFHFADSEVAQVAALSPGPQEGPDAVLCIRFSAACATRADGTGTVWHGRGVEMRLSGMASDPAACLPGDAMGRLVTGHVRHGEVTQRSLPFPSTLTGPLVLELVFSQGAVLVCQATALQLGQQGDAQWFESMAC